MLRYIKRYYHILFIPIFFIIGLMRKNTIQNYQASIGKPTMSGIFSLYALILIGIFLTIVFAILKCIYRSKLKKNTKRISIIVILLVGILLIGFMILFI